MTEKEFVRRAEAMQSRLYRMAYVYFGSESIARDVLDETIYRGLKSYRRLKNQEAFEGWLTKILLNECHREWNYQKKKMSLEELSYDQSTDEDAFAKLPLKLAVRSLPEELKVVILLRFFEGRSIQETAAFLGIPEGTVSTRQRKALGLLKRELGEVEP